MCCSCKQCVNSVSRCYLIVVTILSLLAGAVVIGLGGWLYGEFVRSDELVQGIVVWGPIGFGSALVVVSCLGLIGIFCSSKTNPCCTKCSLSLFLIITFVLWASVLVTSILCLAYASQATTVANSNSFELDGPADKLNTWQLAAYNKCCADTYGLTPKVEPCGTVTAIGKYSGCTTQTDQLCACYNDEELYKEVEKYLNADECEALSRIQFSSSEFLIGDPANSSGCGNGNAKQFQVDFAKFVRQDIYPALFVLIGISAAMLLASFCSCCLLCTEDTGQAYNVAGGDEPRTETADGTVKLSEVEGEKLTMA